MEWYDFIIFGLATLGTGFYGYLEGHRAGFLKGLRAAERQRTASGQQQGESSGD